MKNTNRLPDAGKTEDAAGVTLLANGSSGQWDVDIDESAGVPVKYFAQVQGPAIYLNFEVASLQIVSTALDFLKRSSCTPRSSNGAATPVGIKPLRIGTFGRTPVNLIWDDEFADRCFLSVGVSGKYCLHVTLTGEQIRHLCEALRQVESDLGEIEPSHSKGQRHRRS